MATDPCGPVALSNGREEIGRAGTGVGALRIGHSCRQKVTVKSHWYQGCPSLVQGSSRLTARVKNTNGKAVMCGIHWGC
jgi:hypothetical protein